MRARSNNSQRRRRGNESLISPARIGQRLLTSSPTGLGGPRAFTIIELLIVIAIIGALTAISLPAIKGISQSHTVNNASRQLMDDLALARQYAINNRSVVHVLFVPPDIQTMTFPQGQDLPKRLMTGVYTTYAIYAERTVGDQPGAPRARYLSKWKSLPDGIFIAKQEFDVWDFRDWDGQFNPTNRPFHYKRVPPVTTFPFPTLTNSPIELPHITFSPQGSVIYEDDIGNRKHRDEVIELARGSILASRDEVTGDLQDFDARESPPGNSTNNYIRIWLDGLTGRSTIDRFEINESRGKPRVKP